MQRLDMTFSDKLNNEVYFAMKIKQQYNDFHRMAGHRRGGGLMKCEHHQQAKGRLIKLFHVHL